MPKENVAAGLVVSVASADVLRPNVKVDCDGGAGLASCWLGGMPNENACLLLSAENLKVLGPRAEVEDGDCPFERSIAWSLTSAAPGAREPQATQVWVSALLRTRHVSHSHDPLGGWNMPAREDVAGAFVTALGLSLGVGSLTFTSRGVVQDTHLASSPLLRTRQAWHSQESAALGNREARDGAPLEGAAAPVEGSAGLVVSCSASCVSWAFSNASLKDSA